jgi:hypothetical protein
MTADAVLPIQNDRPNIDKPFRLPCTGHAQTRKSCRYLMFFCYNHYGHLRLVLENELHIPQFIAGPFKLGLFETKQKQKFL